MSKSSDRIGHGFATSLFSAALSGMCRDCGLWQCSTPSFSTSDGSGLWPTQGLAPSEIQGLCLQKGGAQSAEEYHRCCFHVQRLSLPALYAIARLLGEEKYSPDSLARKLLAHYEDTPLHLDMRSVLNKAAQD